MDDTGRYARQSAVTDPGARRPALQGLPSADPSRLRELVPGLVIHPGMGELYGVTLSGRAGEARLRTLGRMLSRLLEISPETLESPARPSAGWPATAGRPQSSRAGSCVRPACLPGPA